MDALFTNPDARLRPNSKLEGHAFVRQKIDQSITLVPISYRLSADAFPELHARLTQMKRRAGITSIEVAIHSNSDRISHTDGLIKIGLHTLNRMTFDDMETALAHELGHAWRAAHPRAVDPMIRYPNIPPHQAAELEADIFARCLTNNPTQTANMLARLDPPRDIYHPHPKIRATVVRHSSPVDCTAFDLAPASTPSTLAQTALKNR
jgi:hypothetical protein